MRHDVRTRRHHSWHPWTALQAGPARPHRQRLGWKQSQLLVRLEATAGQLDVEVLLLHRHLEHADVLSGITAALTVGR